MPTRRRLAAAAATSGAAAATARSARTSRLWGWASWSTQQAGHQLVSGQLAEEVSVLAGMDSCPLRPLVGQLDRPGQPGAVEVGEGPDQLLDLEPQSGVGRGLELLEELLDAVSDGVKIDLIGWPASAWPANDQSRLGAAVGEWIFFRVLPFPRYMCTPQGRHGSKLRTVRMMSMPLKCSRSFSSKIGVSGDGVLVGAGRAVDVAGVGIPGRRRVRDGSWRSCRP